MSDWRTIVREYLLQNTAPLIAVLGPTASGKTAFSLELAEYIQKELQKDSEVINADSRQLYRFLDIGTAKIRSEEMRGIPHHLIDVLDPKEEATVGWYQREAERVIEDIHSRNHVSLLVGGSMLYISAVIDRLTLGPAKDSLLRTKLEEEYDRDQGETLYARLRKQDAVAATRVHPRNKPRLVRAVEILDMHATDVPKDELMGFNAKGSVFLVLGVEKSREELAESIEKRTREMFERGWVEEVRSLLERGYGSRDPGMKSHGYREIMHFLSEGEPTSLEELQKIISTKTRQFAKRQMTWWRRDTKIQWITLPR